MDDYLTKPIRPNVLQEMLMKHAPTPTESDEQLSEKTAPEPPAVVPIDIADLNAAAESIAGGMAGLVKLAPIFSAECDSLFNTMDEALQSGDMPLLHRAAHTLKGSANLFAAKRVTDLAFKVEEDTRSSDSIDLAANVDQLKSETTKLLAALKTIE